MATRVPALIQLGDPRVAAQLVYTIILCLSVFANCRSQFFLDRLGTGEKRAYLRHGWAHTAHVKATTLMMTAVGGPAPARVCACVRVRVCACLRVFARVRVCVCLRAYMRVCVMCLPYTIILFDPGL